MITSNNKVTQRVMMPITHPAMIPTDEPLLMLVTEVGTMIPTDESSLTVGGITDVVILLANKHYCIDTDIRHSCNDTGHCTFSSYI